MKALGCQPVESTSPFKVLVSDVIMHHYIPESADALESTAVHPETYPAARAVSATVVL